MFTIQLYTSSGTPPFPADGFSFVDGMSLFTSITLMYMNDSLHLLGMVSSILDNEPADWDYGCVLLDKP
jgi:hypothetical protein